MDGLVTAGHVAKSTPTHTAATWTSSAGTKAAATTCLPSERATVTLWDHAPDANRALGRGFGRDPDAATGPRAGRRGRRPAQRGLQDRRRRAALDRARDSGRTHGRGPSPRDRVLLRRRLDQRHGRAVSAAGGLPRGARHGRRARRLPRALAPQDLSVRLRRRRQGRGAVAARQQPAPGPRPHPHRRRRRLGGRARRRCGRRHRRARRGRRGHDDLVTTGRAGVVQPRL